ncbi:MAG: metal-dependent hydrolase [Bacteroidetes bacterium MedPE-SWsnd-G2]|nr:MAG: metal-dependent hydrolase [Bacteroidetes bacterium MedPE-SWsnd-G2]
MNTLELEHLKFPIGPFSPLKTITSEDLENYISTLERFPSNLKTLVSELTTEQLNYNYRPNGWNIKQVVHHCADSHTNCLIRFKLTLTEENVTIKPYMEDRWANLIDGTDDTIIYSLKIIEGTHYRLTKLLRSLNEEQRALTYIHPEYNKQVRLDEAIANYAWHCNHHYAHIVQALNRNTNF